MDCARIGFGGTEWNLAQEGDLKGITLLRILGVEYLAGIFILLKLAGLSLSFIYVISLCHLFVWVFGLI